jgi:hypothetical protein
MFARFLLEFQRKYVKREIKKNNLGTLNENGNFTYSQADEK